MIKTLYEIFQHWSAKGSVYLLSDLHLNDDDCLLMDPDWIPPEEQIGIINNKVTRGDTFICLGDVGSPEFAAQIKAGHKVLLLGNHDHRKDYKDIFDEIYEGPLFISESTWAMPTASGLTSGPGRQQKKWIWRSSGGGIVRSEKRITFMSWGILPTGTAQQSRITQSR